MQRHILMRPKGRNQNLAEVFRTGIRQLKQTIMGYKKTESSKHTIKKLLQAARHEANAGDKQAQALDEVKAQVLGKLNNRLKMRSASLCQIQRVATLNSALTSAYESNQPGFDTRDEPESPVGTARSPLCVPLHPLNTVPNLRIGGVLKIGTSPQHKKLNLNIHHVHCNPDIPYETPSDTPRDLFGDTPREAPREMAQEMSRDEPRDKLRDRRQVPWLHNLKIQFERKQSASPRGHLRRHESPVKSPTHKKTVQDLDS